MKETSNNSMSEWTKEIDIDELKISVPRCNGKSSMYFIINDLIKNIEKYKDKLKA